MTRLDWNAVGTRFYEAGVDRGVLYVEGQPGVAWTGLTSVVEHSSGGSQRPFYLDGVKYLNVPSSEEYEATIDAFTYPEAFEQCDGTSRIHTGLLITQQSRKSFSLSYRSKVGNDVDGVDHGYKIHLVYNALASPSQKTNKSIGDSPDPSDFSWDITTRPPTVTGYKRTAHVIVDSRFTNSMTLSSIENILYGSVSNSARMPSLAELIEIFNATTDLVVIDHGDGSFTVNGPDEAITMLDSTTFQITWPSAIFIDSESYTISSA